MELVKEIARRMGSIWLWSEGERGASDAFGQRREGKHV